MSQEETIRLIEANFGDVLTPAEIDKVVRAAAGRGG
jgi:hypothetical protein